MEPEWDSSELVQASKSDCVQLIICDSLIQASQNFKQNAQGFFRNIFLQDEEKNILSLFRKENVGVIAIGHFVENASPEFFSALIFEPVDTNQEHSPTALVYLATCPQFYSLKLLTYLISGLQSYLNQNKKSHHLFCAAPIKQATWYKNNGFQVFSFDPNKENKVVPIEFHQLIFIYCRAKNCCYKDGLQYDENDCRKGSLKFLYLKSDITEDQYFPQQCLEMLAQMTFYKSTSKDSIAYIMPISHSIISSILDTIFQQMNPFICP